MTRLPLILGATLAALAFSPLTAEAGHFGGGGHVGGSAHFSGHFGGGGFHGSIHVGGSVHVGGGFVARGGHFGHARYGYGYGYGWGTRGHVWVGGGCGYYSYGCGWYRPYWYYPGYVSSYYYGSYYPVDASAYAGPSVAAPVAVEPELPRFGIGVAGGMTSTDFNTANNVSETDLDVLGRFRLTQGLIIEGELGRNSIGVNGQDNTRVDRRLGGSLLYEFGAHNRFAPYVLAGLGVEQASTDGSYNTTMDFAEIGAGLRFALTPHFHITFDLRAGSRSTVSQDSSGTTARTTVAPPASDSGQSEDYTRGRLAAILYF